MLMRERAVDAARLDGVDALDAGQRVFQHLGDAASRPPPPRRRGSPPRTDTIGGSIAGSSRRVRRENAITPSTISSRLITVAKTGRWMERSERFIASAPVRASSARRGRRVAPPSADLRARAQLAGAVDDDAVARASGRSQDFRQAVAARADVDVRLLDAAVGLDPEHERVARRPAPPRSPAPAAPGARRACRSHVHQHARAQRAVGVGEVAAHGDRARGRIDARVDGA